MMLQLIYLVLCILGFVLPYAQLIPFILKDNLNFYLFFEQMFTNHISSLFALDVLISSVVFWIFLVKEGIKLKMKFLWIYIVCNLIVGLSLALPLFLLMRQRQIAKQTTIKTV